MLFPAAAEHGRLNVKQSKGQFMRLKPNLLMSGFGAALLLSGCATKQHAWGTSHHRGNVVAAVVELSPTQGNTVNGMVMFTQVPDGIHVVAEIRGLTPGKHGFHVHEKGDCSAPDGTSAGGHFNPTGMPHGAPNAVNRHVGDFGNIVAGQDGVARADFIDTHIALSGPNSIVDRAIIVHGGEDDLVSQPSGNAGPRVACGVIRPM